MSHVRRRGFLWKIKHWVVYTLWIWIDLEWLWSLDVQLWNFPQWLLILQVLLKSPPLILFLHILPFQMFWSLHNIWIFVLAPLPTSWLDSPIPTSEVSLCASLSPSTSIPPTPIRDPSLLFTQWSLFLLSSPLHPSPSSSIYTLFPFPSALGDSILILTSTSSSHLNISIS